MLSLLCPLHFPSRLSRSFIAPAGLALLRSSAGTVDLRTACGGGARLAVSAFTSALTLLGGHLAHADFADGESCVCGL